MLLLLVFCCLCVPACPVGSVLAAPGCRDCLTRRSTAGFATPKHAVGRACCRKRSTTAAEMRALRIWIRRGDRGHEVVLGAKLGVWEGTAVIADRNYLYIYIYIYNFHEVKTSLPGVAALCCCYSRSPS